MQGMLCTDSIAEWLNASQGSQDGDSLISSAGCISCWADWRHGHATI